MFGAIHSLDLQGGDFPGPRTGFPSRSSSRKRRLMVSQPWAFTPILGGDGGTTHNGRISRFSDEKGRIEFGVIQPWILGIRPFARNRRWRRVAIGGEFGRDARYDDERTFICPEAGPLRLPLTVDIDWPKDLTSPGLAVLATFRHQRHTYQPPLHWDLHEQTLGLVEPSGISPNASCEPVSLLFWLFHTSTSGSGLILPTSAVPSPLEGIKPGQTYVDLLGTGPGFVSRRSFRRCQDLPGSKACRAQTNEGEKSRLSR